MAVHRVHHLNCGTMCPIAASLIGSPGGLFSRGRLVCHCLLIETDAGLVLIETGFGTGDIAEPLRLRRGFLALNKPRLDVAETALAQVQALGHDPRDVRHIVVTHLDVDHAGGLADFPWAAVHVHGAEQRAALAQPSRKERARYVSAHFAHGPDWRCYDDAGDRWFGFDAVASLDGLGDDIALIPLVGHSRGHSGVAVRQSDTWLLHAGDAYFHAGSLATPPRVPLGLRLFQRATDVDRESRVRNGERLRELARDHADEVKIFCAHDPNEMPAEASP